VGLAVAAGIADRPSKLREKLSPTLGGRIDAKWGAAFSFPVAAGAGFYLAGTTYVGPEISELGPHTIVLTEHVDRVHRVNYRTSTSFSYASGYVREVYEINFLSDAHLRAPLLNSTVRAYAGTVGRLRPSSLSAHLWEWRLEPHELERARADWEDSGLVLAAAREPFRWQ
jgi:hypothetical protein